MYSFTVYNSNTNLLAVAFTFKAEESNGRINSQAIGGSNNTPFHNAYMSLICVCI